MCIQEQPCAWQARPPLRHAVQEASKRLQGELEDSGARKDANEVLLKDGPGPLRTLLEASPAYPIKGLYKFSDYRLQIWDAYDGANEHDKPVSTGWKVLDEFYRVVPGELTVVTGTPPPPPPPPALIRAFVPLVLLGSSLGRVASLSYVA